jgi:hypothetical protein
MLRTLIAFAMMTTPAFGLSCAPPNFGEAFNEAAEAEEVYSLVYGRFQEAGPIPDYVEGQPREFTYAFIGKQLGQSGFSQTQTIPVIIKTECVSAWCGPVPPVDTQVLSFLEHVGSDHVLTSHTCPKDYKVEPSLGEVSAVRACMSNLSCGPEELGALGPH